MSADERDCATASTTCSNGTSLFSNADRSAARTLASSSATVGSPDTSVRSTRVFRKKPTSWSSRASSRTVTGDPSGMSVPAPSRDSRTATDAWNTMNIDVPVDAASSLSATTVSGRTPTRTPSPRPDGRGGRARS
ncbi:Uncharacterised protein [Mycobacteroides abscessus subsp. abscessus]|nr:Uncharacterised protein [Mycobacteroides abscessus subsp. abscessus]